MSQRYFLTAESTYEDLRQYLNTELSYPNSLGKSVFQTALYAPRDFFRRVLLAVDTDLPGYSTIDSAITPLLASDAMEEIDETTYLLAVASPVEWVSATDPRLSDARTPTSHSHGNITNAGAIGSTSGLPIITTTSGVLTVGAFGSSAGQFAAGDHTHSQLHDRSHAITSSSDHTATAWRVFYSESSGSIAELALGASGTVLQSNGASSAPSWATPSGGGSTSASDLTSGTLSDFRLSAKAQAALNVYLWSAFR